MIYTYIYTQYTDTCINYVYVLHIVSKELLAACRPFAAGAPGGAPGNASELVSGGIAPRSVPNII